MLAGFGPALGNADWDLILAANTLINRYGLDVGSSSGYIAWLMELWQRGIIDEKDTEGLNLEWGNKEAILQLIPKIALREGIGDLLAEGVKRASEKIGGGSEKWALHIKGQELPMDEPRGKKGLGLSYATSNRGACHLQFQHDDSLEQPPQKNPHIPKTGSIR